MSATAAPTAVAAGEPAKPPPRRHRRLLAGAALVSVAAAGAALVLADPFGGGAPASGTTDNTYPTSLATLARQTLTQQTQLSGTLGYAGYDTVRVPSGTAPQALTQAEQAVATVQGQLVTAQTTLAADSRTLSQARATLVAEQAQEAVVCQGDNAAQATASGVGSNGGAGAGTCAADAQLVTSDQQAVTADAAKVAADQQQVASAARSLADAQTSLAAAGSQATVYGQNSTFAGLPSVGAVIHRGQSLFAIDGQPVLLLYGVLPATRAFRTGMSRGPDVAELNANLDALGVGRGLAGEAFTGATAAAIRGLQAAHGLRQSGVLSLGSVIFESGAVRVTSVLVSVGTTVSPGPVMTLSSTARQVAIELDASEQGQVKIGDPVIITLPDNTTTPARISYVSPVATSADGSTSIRVDAVPTDLAATGTLDQAPVEVAITTATVEDALVVPVNALLALSSGGYALEEVDARGVHHLVAVSTGLFDDADGLVQVTGAGLAAGQRVVVPGT